ncbi:MAG: ABC transporter permease [Bacteroidetes bacterium]|nr:MAG: ABC transporter permease [Bacteroidota bacterium]
MRETWIIAQREFRSYLDSLVAYILLVVFLGLTGAFTWLIMADVFMIKQATMEPFFNVAYWSLFFFIPALTMRMLAEERRTGTLEVLLTRKVSDWQAISGKFLGAFLLIAVSLLFTLPFYVSITWLGPVDHGAVWCGYLGLLLLSAFYISMGIFASSLTDNPIVALLLALLIGISFHWIFGILSSVLPGAGGRFFHFLSASNHFDSMARGVIDSRDVIYFLSFSLLALILAEARLAWRHVADASMAR